MAQSVSFMKTTLSSCYTRSPLRYGHFSFWRRKQLYGGKIKTEGTMETPEKVIDVKPVVEGEVKSEDGNEKQKGFKREIAVDKYGKIAVTGPLDNPLICMGMLEMGKEAIINFHRERAMRQAMAGKPGIIPGMPPLVIQ
jgi:hypothetical protein